MAAAVGGGWGIPHVLLHLWSAVFLLREEMNGHLRCADRTGFMNAWGTFQFYYHEVLLAGMSNSTLAWIGALQVGMPPLARRERTVVIDTQI